jgi:3-hydroxybutyrate dehydrogenase
VTGGERETRVAIVTGGAGGIGSAIARRLAADGVAVVVADLEADGAASVASSIPGATSATVDLADPDACGRLVHETLDRSGRIDILVNNAGLQHVSPIHEFPTERWDLLLRIMLTAPFLLTRAVLPAMYERGWGRIVNMGSIHSLIASPNKAAYVAAKHGLLGLTRATALEAGPMGVTANLVCPSFVRTPLVKNQIADLARTEGIDPAEVEERIILGPAAVKRLIEPDEVAALVGHLCSDAAGAITGSALPSDAGWTAR